MDITGTFYDVYLFIGESEVVYQLLFAAQRDGNSRYIFILSEYPAIKKFSKKREREAECVSPFGIKDVVDKQKYRYGFCKRRRKKGESSCFIYDDIILSCEVMFVIMREEKIARIGRKLPNNLDAIYDFI